VLTFSVEARAAFVGWAQEVYETYFSHRYTGTDRVAPSNTIYYPKWVPDGYETTAKFDSKLPITIIYSHKSGDSITFSCLMSTESANLQIDREHTDAINTFVGNKSATLYLDTREGEANVLVWTDEQAGVLFVITSTLGQDTMLKIAEGVDILESEK